MDRQENTSDNDTSKKQTDARPLTERDAAVSEPMSYLKAVIEGAADIEPWKSWFERNATLLADRLTRTEYLDLKLHRIRAIPRILEKFDVAFNRSSRYEYLGGVPGLCRDCGAEVLQSQNFERIGGSLWCPNGCFRIHALRHSRPETNSDFYL